MKGYLCVGVAAVCVLGSFTSGVRGQTVTEIFDSAASATLNGWVASGDGINGQVAGWSSTSEAGGAAAGEGRAQLSKGWPARDGYRDLTIGGAFTVNQGFSFSGKLDLL